MQKMFIKNVFIASLFVPTLRVSASFGLSVPTNYDQPPVYSAIASAVIVGAQPHFASPVEYQKSEIVIKISEVDVLQEEQSRREVVMDDLERVNELRNGAVRSEKIQQRIERDRKNRKKALVSGACLVCFCCPCMAILQCCGCDNAVNCCITGCFEIMCCSKQE